MSSPLVAESHELLVVLAPVGGLLKAPDDEARLRAVLSEDERARADRYKVAWARREHVCGRALARHLIGRAVARAPNELSFRVNEWGRPELEPWDDRSARLRFNVSHSHGLVACAVGWGGEIGVDVEDETRDVDELALAPDVFAPAEVAGLYATVAHGRRAQFFFHWTLKEAYIKARGRGVSLPLEQIAFARGASGEPALSFDARFDDQHPERWQLSCFRWGERHVGAVAASREGSQSRGLRLVELGSLDALLA